MHRHVVIARRRARPGGPRLAAQSARQSSSPEERERARIEREKARERAREQLQRAREQAERDREERAGATGTERSASACANRPARSTPPWPSTRAARST